jgi:hypothetical protein
VLLLYFCQDALAVDCCEGGGLPSWKGIMIFLLVVKAFQLRDGWIFSEGFHCLFLNKAMILGYQVEGGTNKAANT